MLSYFLNIFVPLIKLKVKVYIYYYYIYFLYLYIEARTGAAKVRPFTDPLQFAYQPHLGVENGIIYLLNRVYTHLDKLVRPMRVMLFDYSSAFNTIRPALLGEKMAAMQVDAPSRPGLLIT